jgi:hypothetical protein
LRYQVELKDTAKQYLWSILKDECWDQMVVKGKQLLGFHTLVVVSNYAMRERSEEEVAELEYVSRLRQVEEIDKSLRQNIFPPELASYSSLIGN